MDDTFGDFDLTGDSAVFLDTAGPTDIGMLYFRTAGQGFLAELVADDNLPRGRVRVPVPVAVLDHAENSFVLKMPDIGHLVDQSR